MHRRRRSHAHALAALLLAAVPLAACGGSGSNDGPPPSSATDAATSASPGPTPAGPASPAPSGDDAGGPPPSAPLDAGSDAHEDAAVSDAASDAPSDAPAPHLDPCDPGAAPAGVTPVNLQIVALPSNGQVPVQTTGGDPNGTWRVTAATAYLPAAAMALLDTKATKGTLSGWLAFAGADLRLDVRADVNAVILGKAQEDKQAVTGRASAKASGSTIAIQFACVPDGGTPNDSVSYTVQGTKATLVKKQSSLVGDVFLVLEGERVSGS